MSLLLVNANALHVPLADGSVQMCVTSPPYWGLRDYGISNQLGLETTPDCLGWATGTPCGECYICHTVAWAREVWRVLRDDGTFWLNLGDSYAGSGQGVMGDGSQVGGDKQRTNAGSMMGLFGTKRKSVGNLKPKDLIGIPWRVALALQADGWWLRSDIIWHKPNPMPESVTDRPTKAHEYLFLLSKSASYYYDADAIREPIAESTIILNEYPHHGKKNGAGAYAISRDRQPGEFGDPAGRNRRTVWTISTESFSGAHYATFPRALVEPCIKAGSSERGCCPECGMAWVRVTENNSNWQERKANGAGSGSVIVGHNTEHGRGMSHDLYANRRSTGFAQSCACPPHDPIPCTVLDPFAGSGTTLLVARQLGRHAVGLDLSYPYLHDQARARLDMTALEEWQTGKRNERGVLDDLPLFGM